MSAPSQAGAQANLAHDGQSKAADPASSAWVSANAGSGKTKVLIDRVARLLRRPGVKPDQILCVTYTKAAASEMQDRLFRRLGAWTVMDKADLAQQLAELEGRSDFTDAEIDAARALFADALETPGGLRIETIHAFCGRVLRRFPLEAGVAPGFRELDEPETSELWEDAFRSLGRRIAMGQEALRKAAAHVAEEGGSDFAVLHKLDSRRGQVEAFISRHKGAKKAAEALRLHLSASELSAEKLLKRGMGDDLPRGDLARAAAAYRFGGVSDAKQAELIEYALLDHPAEERMDALLSIPFTGKGEARKNIATKGVLAAHPVIAELFDPATGTETLRLIALKQALDARRIWERSAALLTLAETAFADFRKRKQARAGLDFDDLIHGVNGLLTRSKAAEWVLWKLDGGISHLLLDEAQDTSPEQWRILRALTDDMFAGAGSVRESPRTMFVVGDQKQSIYSFQGADPEHFLREGRAMIGRADIGDMDLVRPTLATSFRSTAEVLAYVDETFDPDSFPDRAPFSIAVPDMHDVAPHAAHRGEAGSVELWPLEPPPDIPEPDPWDAPVDQQSQESPKARLARRIASFVKGEIARGARVWEGGKARPAHAGDFLILVKGRVSGLFDAVLHSLRAAQLPVAGADRILLLDSLAVQDLLNLVRFALCPEDDLVVAEILKGPFCGLTDDDLLELAWGRDKASLWSRVQASSFGPAKAFLEGLLARRHEPPFEYLGGVLERAGADGRTGWRMILSRMGDPAREPVTALLDRAAAYDASSPPSLQLFLDAIEAHGGEVKRELSGASHAVRVMTVHGAKGLEAPIVILPDTTSAPRNDRSGLFVIETPDERDPMRGAPVWAGGRSGDIPATAALRTLSDELALREHRRLLYVALTRARDRLVVCGAWSEAVGNVGGAARDSWHAICQAGMQRLVEKGAAKEDIDAEGRTVIRVGEAPAAAPGLITAPRATVLPEWIDAPPPQEPALARVLAPSSLGGMEPPALSPFGPDRETRFRRGRLIHALFEHLPEIAPRSRRKAGRDFLAKQPDLSKAQQEEMLTAAMTVIEDERFAAVFERGGRAEAPVVGRLGASLLNGRVDRLVVRPHEVLIIDYKTDRPAPPSLALIGPAYVAQMAAYREILGKSWPGKAIRCLLVWTDGPQLMEIPDQMLDDAIRTVRA